MLFWAMAALYLCIGSLVHFHQYKIYGKQLVAEVVISKREHEVSVKDTNAGSNLQSGIPAILADTDTSPAFSAITIVFGGPQTGTVHTCCLANSGLRAPPLS